MLHVGLAVEQKADHLGTPLEAGQRERRVAVGLDLGVDVGAHVQEQLHRGHVAVHSRQHQRGDAKLTASPKEGGRRRASSVTACSGSQKSVNIPQTQYTNIALGIGRQLCVYGGLRK